MKRGWYREPARHSLARRGVKTPRKSAVGFYSSGRQVHVKPPPVLYHGTLAKNLPMICRYGLVPSSPSMVTPMTREAGHASYTIGVVSLAVREGDARIYAWGSASKDDEVAVITIDTSKLADYKLFFSPMFGKELAEARYYGIIPPSAIKRIEVTQMKDGKLVKRDVTCEVLR